jgi:RNA polymerase sigma factor (sigma-70 family)
MAAGTVSELLPDHTLLARFATQGDAAAFAEMLRRHGPMVRATCRRHLGNSDDADDAFQCVFLVLVRRAASIRHGSLLGPWLHTVAVRAARKALALRQRRLRRERPVAVDLEPACLPAEPHDWLPLLDEAMQGLPEKYRVPLLLCELEGMSRADAAAQLALAEGTLSSRLARGRTLLRKRLARRGVTVTVVALTAGLATQALAQVPAGLVASTTQAVFTGAVPAPVATLTQEVLHAMFVAKLQFVGSVLLGLILVLASGSAFVWHVAAQTPEPQAPAAKDREALQGTWKVVDAQINGKDIDAQEQEMIKGKPFVFEGNKLTVKVPTEYRLDATKTPREIDIVPTEGPENEKGQTFRGIYDLKGDDLRIAFQGPTQARPKSFDEAGAMLFTLKRQKKE